MDSSRKDRTILNLIFLLFLCVPNTATNGISNGLANGVAKSKVDDFKMQIKWRNVVMFTVLHIVAFYGLYLPKLRSTIIVGWTIGILSGFGTTVGSHRLFTHRTFKANQKLKVLMMLLQTMAGQEVSLL